MRRNEEGYISLGGNLAAPGLLLAAGALFLFGGAGSSHGNANATPTPAPVCVPGKGEHDFTFGDGQGELNASDTIDAEEVCRGAAVRIVDERLKANREALHRSTETPYIPQIGETLTGLPNSLHQVQGDSSAPAGS